MRVAGEIGGYLMLSVGRWESAPRPGKDTMGRPGGDGVTFLFRLSLRP